MKICRALSNRLIYNRDMINEATKSPIRSAMLMFTNPTKKGKLWSRTDAIRAKRNAAKRAETVQNYREKLAAKKAVAPKRFALVKKFKTNYHVVGLGFVNAETFADLKVTLKTAGYTNIRLGGLKFNL